MGTSYRPEVSKKNKYWISRHRFYEISHMCYQYFEWKDEYKALSKQGIKAVEYDGMPHGSDVGTPTENAGIKLSMLRNKIELVEKTAEDADPVLAKYILKAVTNDNVTFEYLKNYMNMPCEKDMYYDRRRKFYWLMSQRI